MGDPSSLQGDERSVVLLSMVASKGSCPTQVGRMYEQRFNVALSRARDRMVLFRSVNSADVPSRQDLKVHTISFFSNTDDQIQTLNRTPSSNLNLFTDSTVEGQLLNFLSDEGFSFDTSCSIAGSLAVVEDLTRDSRLVICVDGGGGRTLSRWKRDIKNKIFGTSRMELLSSLAFRIGSSIEMLWSVIDSTSMYWSGCDEA